MRPLAIGSGRLLQPDMRFAIYLFGVRVTLDIRELLDDVLGMLDVVVTIDCYLLDNWRASTMQVVDQFVTTPGGRHAK